MTTHKIGIDESTWRELSDALGKHKRAKAMSVGLLPGGVVSFTVDTNDPGLEIHLQIIHLDVAQGESTLILLTCESTLCRELGRSDCLMSILIDGGLYNEGGGLIARTLRLMNVRYLDAALISHFDADHTEGVTRILDEIGGRERAEQRVQDARTDVNSAQDEITKIEASIAASGATTDLSGDRKRAVSRLKKAEDALREAKDFLDRFEVNLDEAAETAARNGTAGWKSVQTQKVFVRADPENLPKATNVVKRLSQALDGITVDTLTVEKGDVIKLDCSADRGLFSMTCLAVNLRDEGMDEDAENAENAENANSIAWLLSFGKYRYYTAGDLPSTLGANKIEDSLTFTEPLTAFKCGHHGAKGSTSADFLKAAKPRLAFVSSGKQDGFGHPHASTLLRLGQAAGLEAIFITNCYYNRPLINTKYKENAVQSMLDQLGSALVKLAGWQIPDIPPNATANKPSNENQPGRMREMKSDHAAMCAKITKIRGKLLSESIGCSEATLVDVCGARGILETWAKEHGHALSELAHGVTISSTGYQADFNRDSDSYEDALKDLRSAAAEASDMRETINAPDKSPGSLPQVHLAGVEGKLGNITLLMNLSDADKDDRTCYVGYELKNEWLPFREGIQPGNSVPHTQSPEVDQLTILETAALLEIPVPQTPQLFSPYVEKRNKQKKRKRELDGDEMDASSIPEPNADPDRDTEFGRPSKRFKSDPPSTPPPKTD